VNFCLVNIIAGTEFGIFLSQFRDNSNLDGMGFSPFAQVVKETY